MAGARTTAGERQSEAGSDSLRLCAVSRAQRPPEELIRFVLAPDGSIVPDLARRLPGRGVWVAATRDTVAAAVRQKAFAKSLKQQVSMPDDLPGLVERLLVKRVGEALSLTNKAGLLVAGFANGQLQPFPVVATARYPLERAKDAYRAVNSIAQDRVVLLP